VNQNAILARYRRWLLVVANSMTEGEDNRQDLAQEGWIAMWRALQAFDQEKGSLPSWLTTAARMRMGDVVRRGLTTGAAPRYGGHSAVEIPVDKLPEPIKEALHTVELAYHAGEIRQAIDQLTPIQREYVIRRFWGDEAHTAISSDIGNGWVGARPKLRTFLGHLE